MPEQAKRPATYADIEAAPEHLVAEIREVRPAIQPVEGGRAEPTRPDLAAVAPEWVTDPGRSERVEVDDESVRCRASKSRARIRIKVTRRK